jgi:membrane associated rhomboid family serine protease
MFAVFMFGVTLEKVWGAKRYLIYYMITGIGAGIIQECVWFFSFHDLIDSGMRIVTDRNISITLNQYLYVTIGASGAVFGVLLAFGMLFPNTPLYIMFIPIPIKAKYFVIGYGIIELYLGFANHAGDNVAHFAHLGGMLFGLILILVWKHKDRKNGYYY